MKQILYFLSLLMLTAMLWSCEEEVNQWDVDSSSARLFRPLSFELSNSEATSVEVRFTKIISASKYVFEFYQDSLKFENLVNTVEVDADTITPFSKSTTLSRIEYRPIFEDLNGSTGYSIRMKGIDEKNGTESQYLAFYFETAEEQLFEDYTVYTDKIDLTWGQTNKITHISVFNSTTSELLEEKVLSEEEIANAKTTVENLSPGIIYKIEIANNEIIRGTRVLKTAGLANSTIINVAPTDVIADLISAAVAEGNANITLVFSGTELYNIQSLIIPTGVGSLSFTGNPNADGSLPMLYLEAVSLTDLVLGSLNFQNIDLQGTISNYLFNIATDDLQVEAFIFSNCKISDYKAIIRMKNNTISTNKIDFKNCWINNTGGYGVINIGGSNVSCDTLSFSHCTMTELSTQLMDVRTPIGQIYIGNCTQCNFQSTMSQLLRLDTNNLPLSIITEDNIIAGNNGGAELNALNIDMSTTALYVSFVGSYRTSEIAIKKYDFAEITVFGGTTYDLFVDPDNQDFTIKDDSGFAGRGTAGDSRWFK